MSAFKKKNQSKPKKIRLFLYPLVQDSIFQKFPGPGKIVFHLQNFPQPPETRTTLCIQNFPLLFETRTSLVYPKTFHNFMKPEQHCVSKTFHYCSKLVRALCFQNIPKLFETRMSSVFPKLSTTLIVLIGVNT